MFYGSLVTLYLEVKYVRKIKKDIQKFSLHDFQSVQNVFISVTAKLILDIGIGQNFHIGASLLHSHWRCRGARNTSTPPNEHFWGHGLGGEKS